MKKLLALLFAGVFALQSVAYCSWPSSSSRTKEWSSSDVLTEPDLEGQFDVIHTYLNDMLNTSTGHNHDGTSGNGPKIPFGSLTVASQAQGDIMYNNGSAWTRLGAGTAGQFLRTGGASANPTWSNEAAAPRALFSGLVITYASSSSLTVTANDLVLYDTNNSGTTVNSVSETITITTSGASGLVSALSEAANTIYYVWIARKSSDGTVNGYLSTTTSYSTFLGQVDSGYDQVALVGCVGNNNSSNFIAFHQVGRRYTFDAWATMASGSAGTTPWVAIDLTPANMTTNAGFVPSALSTFAFGSVTIDASNAIFITNDNTVTDGTSPNVRNKIGTSGGNDAMSWSLDVITADTLYWISANASASVFLHGFELNKL